MITLRMQLTVFPEAIVDLAEDTWIQILDYNTYAHYRYDKSGQILLDGESTGKTWEDLLNRQVKYIGVDKNHLEIYIW